jgi:hypothetical protein
MPGIERFQGLEPRIDQLSKKVQELRERGGRRAAGLDEGLNVVERNGGRRDALEAEMSLMGLSSELSLQGEGLHGLDPARVADLISDPFEDD